MADKSVIQITYSFYASILTKYFGTNVHYGTCQQIFSILFSLYYIGSLIMGFFWSAHLQSTPF